MKFITGLWSARIQDECYWKPCYVVSYVSTHHKTTTVLIHHEWCARKEKEYIIYSCHMMFSRQFNTSLAQLIALVEYVEAKDPSPMPANQNMLQLQGKLKILKLSVQWWGRWSKWVGLHKNRACTQSLSLSHFQSFLLRPLNQPALPLSNQTERELYLFCLHFKKPDESFRKYNRKF